MRKSLLVTTILMMVVLSSSPAITTAKDDANSTANEVKKMHAAEAVLKASVSAPDKGIPRNLLEKAECVGVFPDVKKGAFIVGGEGGKGVFTCRTSNGMSGPAFFKIGGPSIGWQAGFQEADLVLLIMNKEGVNKLLKDKFTIGGEASAAAGPVGRTAQAGTDILMHAQILSWSRSRGLFAGISLEGIVVTQDKDDNADLYGRPLEARQILTSHSLPVPVAARSFVNTTGQFTKPVS